MKNVYDHIASDFSASRYKMWPMVEKFVSQVQSDELLVDLGCGNGKNLIPVTRNGLGLEISEGRLSAGDFFSTLVRPGANLP